METMYLLVSLLFSILSVASATVLNTTTAHCASYSCGTVHVEYPFWVDHGRDEQCGYLRLECRGGDTAVMPLPSGDYAVKQIDYRDQRVTLVDLAATGAACPRLAGRNLTVPPPLALTARNAYIDFLLECSFTGIAHDHVVTCLHHGRNSTYYFREGEGEGGFVPYHYSGFCQELVSLPVLNPLDDVVDALRSGFEITWKAAAAAGGACGLCEASGGLCGHRRETAQGPTTFECFGNAASASAATTTSASASAKNQRIAVAVIGSLVLMMAVVLACSYLRHRRQEDSTGDVNSLYRLGI